MSGEDGEDTAKAWRVLDSKVTFSDRWLTVRTDRCVMPNGMEVSPYHVIVSRDWTAVVALTPDLRLVMIREYRHARERIIDGIPGGVVDGADAGGAMSEAEAGARRELLEETGYGGGRFFPILTTYPDPGNQTNIATGFLALDVVPVATQSLDPTEAIDVYLADFPTVMKRLSTGELRLHAVHVAALWSATSRILAGDPDLAVTAPLRQQLLDPFARP